MKPSAEVRQRLSSFTLCQSLAAEPELLDLFVQALEPVSFPAAHDVVRKGESGTEAYLLASGTVEIVDYTMQRDPYVKAVLNETHNVVFGEMALVSNCERTATVRARTACTCWMLERDHFLRLGVENPRLGWIVLLEIARLLADRLKHTNQDVLRLFEALVMEVEGELGTRRGPTR